MRWWWCTLFLSVMTGNRCSRQEMTMGDRGAHGVCGTEERPCPTSRVPGDSPATQPEVSTAAREEIDYYSQARKALCERSPFDIAEDASASTVPHLPRGLASLLNKYCDGRRRQKKSLSGADKKKSARAGDKSRGSNIWVDTDEYFRDMSFPDIDTLFEVSTFAGLENRKCFSIPVLGEARPSIAGSGENENGTGNCVNGNYLNNETSSMEMDTAEADVLPSDTKSGSSSHNGSSSEWLLGCRNKVSLTSERPSKKRKLLGDAAGLQKVLIAAPGEGDSSVCHYCSAGDTGNESNRLIVCSSCKVSVHMKCYGVQGDVDEFWLCSWCKKKKNICDSVNPCVLCPRKGGALKPVHSAVENGGSLEFAHLFCCLWLPEVYIEDLSKMEPVMNVGGIQDTRRKLVCNMCKVKCGACVRCSHGTCRTSFHPICAREARHKMEVWAKYGHDNVELRAFCSKHSEAPNNLQSGDQFLAVSSEPSVNSGHPVAVLVNKHKLKMGNFNGDVTGVNVVSHDNSSDKPGDIERLETGRQFSDPNQNARLMVEDGSAQHVTSIAMAGRSNEDLTLTDSLNFVHVLRKLVDRGKVNLKEVALDVGISLDSLTASLSDDSMVLEMQCKIFNWLKAHAYINTLQKSLKVKIKPLNSFKDETGVVDGSHALCKVSELDMLDPVAVKSVPPRRRTRNNVRILNDSKVICSSEASCRDNGLPLGMINRDQSDIEEPEELSQLSTVSADEMNSIDPVNLQESLPRNAGDSDKPCARSFSERDDVTMSLQDATVKENQHYPISSSTRSADPGPIKTEAVSSYYVHPHISKKLLQIQKEQFLEQNLSSKEQEVSWLEESSGSGASCSSQSKLFTCNATGGSDNEKVEQLVVATKTGVLESPPEDEVEGEIIYFQHRLLLNAVARKQFADNMICKVAKSLPEEINVAWQQRWDMVHVSQYLCNLREAKKIGRKERRHKEAQAVLAAATAAAAASSRVSSFRKDAPEDSAQQENMLKLDPSGGRHGISSQPIPQAKETLSRVAVTRMSSDKHSKHGQLVSDFSKEHSRLCDICRQSDTMLNPILVCSGCKVAVHLDCYRSVKESTGPWFCELCEYLSSQSSGASVVNCWEKPYSVAECGLCGGTTGAFRKSSSGQWVHAFCAEWVFKSTFRRGQVNPIEGMETVLKGTLVCYICRRQYGVCIKCNYGHCQTTFHPSCARSAGLYIVKMLGGKMQHKAYCEKHSSEQRAKAETQKHGIEELKSIKQIRVELERLRLLCERIVKREKIKRDLVICSHDILAFRRDHAARSMLVHSPFFIPDGGGSSESATTSLKGHTDDYKSCSDAGQRSDDVTVDSTLPAKNRARVTLTMDTDQRTDDDCSTSQSHNNQRVLERFQFSGKQIPRRASHASCNLFDDGGWRSQSRKHAETFEKELVMTSDEASVKNLMLPKGYAYVPADCLSSDKQINQDVPGSEPPGHDG